MIKAIERRAILLTALLTLPLATQAQTYLDPQTPVSQRVEDLLGRMTLAEKIGQMTQADRGALTSESDITAYLLGSLLSGGGSAPADNSPKGWADMYDRFQARALATRLKIPLIYGIDAVHGHNNVKGAVIFPHNIALGATRDAELTRRAAEITAIEVAGTGIDWTFAPCVAVVGNERWGRTYEGFAEETDLSARLGAAAVHGLQGDSLGQPGRILACAKHYLGDGGTQNGTDQGNTVMDEAVLRARFLPPYISAIAAGVGTVMPSYSSWNGAKMHGHRYLLTTVLKGELGFDGFVISDWAGIDQLPGDYHSDVVQSVNAGVDMVMVPTNYADFISELTRAVNGGEIPLARIDDAVRRILRIKFRLGLFEQPLTDRNLTTAVGSEAHREVARDCVRRSLVLLTKKDGLLPLSRSLKRIHVAGNGADNLGYQCGGWTIAWQGASGAITTGTTILEALKAEAPGINFTYSPDGSGAEGADLAIAVIGETPYAEYEGDRDDLHLPAKVVEPLRACKAAGLRTVVLLLSGRPLLIDSILPYSDVLIAAWLPGSEGAGVSDVLFGRHPFTGLLPHSWPAAMSDIPVNWGDDPYRPLYPYGHGLTSTADSAPGGAPLFHAAAVNPEGDTLTVSFNKAMAAPSASTPAEWSVLTGWGVIDVTGISRHQQDPFALQLALATPVVKRDVIYLQYHGSSIASADGASLAPFDNQPVYNLLNDMAAKQRVPGRIEAEDFAQMRGVQTEATTDIGGGLNVGYIDNGDQMLYEFEATSAGTYQVEFRIAAESKAGKISLIDNGASLGSIDLPVTGGWQTWQTVSMDAILATGSHKLWIIASRGGFNLNYIDFVFITTVEHETAAPPAAFRLEANYPNPFNAGTTILCSLPAGRGSGRLLLLISDTLGRQVRRLDRQASGSAERFYWDGCDDAGNPLPSGLYTCTARLGSAAQTRKMLLLR